MKKVILNQQKRGVSYLLNMVQLPIMTLVLTVISFYGSKAQNNFQSDLSRNSRYYDSLLAIRGADSMQGTGYVQYQRWLRYWAPKLLPDKDYSDYQDELLEYAQNYVAPNSATIQQHWHEIGPNGTNEEWVDNYTGQIHYIYKHPKYLNTIFACSPVGGLFVSYNGGENWENAGTDKGLPRSGVSSVVVDKFDNWYITTGNGESYLDNTIWQQAIGVYASKDKGGTWTKLGLDSYFDQNNNIPEIQSMRKIIDVSGEGENTNLIVTTTNGVFKISNANTANPEIEILEQGEFYDVERDMIDPTIIYASGSTNTGVYKINLSNNQSNPIININDLDAELTEDEKRRVSIEISSFDPNTIYAIFTSNGDDNPSSLLYKYNIQNQTLIGPFILPHQAESFNGYERTLGWDIFNTLNNNNNLTLVGSNVHYYVSINNCLTLSDGIESVYLNEEPFPTHADCHYILIVSAEEIWAGTDGGVYKGSISGNTITWQTKNKGLGVATVEHMDASINYTTYKPIVSSGQFDCGSFIYRTNDEINWSSSWSFGADGFASSILNDKQFYLSKQEEIIFKDFTVVPPVEDFLWNSEIVDCNNNALLNPWLIFNTYFKRKGDILYGAGPQGVTKYTGTTWIEWSKFNNINLYPEMGCNRSGVWRVALTNGTTKYASTYGKTEENEYFYHRIYKQTSENAENWKLVPNQPVTNRWINSICTDIDNENIVFVAMRGNVFKVNTSIISNPVWIPINYDLPTTPENEININCVEFDHINNRIWIGTDRGIFFLDENSTNWINYSQNLPNVEIKDIRILDNRIYVATYGRGIWFASTPECIADENTIINVGPSDNVLAGIVKTYYTNIQILPSTTFKVEGTLKMAANCRIIVQRNAKLIVDGGTITNACPDMWGGIEVWGSSDKAQTAQYQGIVQLTNATIEHAETAIKTIKTATGMPGGYDRTYSGGMVFATNSIFTDNAVSTEFYTYPISSQYLIPDLSSISYFVGCDFNYTDDIFYFNPNRNLHHIILSGIKGVRFDDCQFNRQTPEHADYIRNMGIVGTDAGFQVINSDFNSLDYGIYCSNTMLGIKSILIDNNQFVNNWRGIYMGAVNYPIVTLNTFSIKNPFDIPNPWVVASGLYMDNCSGYSIEENVFYSNYSHSFQNLSEAVGVVLNNSGTENNILYNNEFHNLPYGTIAQNVNRNYYGDKGLQIKCNDYSENYFDISVLYSQPHIDNGIAAFQGSSIANDTAPAGNLFTRDTDPASFFNYLNNGGHFYYYLPAQSVAFDLPIVPINRSNETKITLSFNDNLAGWNQEVGCPSHLSNHSILELKNLIYEYETTFNVYSDSLNTLVDAGNTTELTLDVATSIPPETMQLRSELLSASPYLSDTVMVSAVEKEEVLPNSILTEVLTSNPQSAKSEKVLNKLNERQTPPTENQMAMIHANDTVLGHKEELETGKAHYSALQHQATGQLVRLYMKDSIQSGIADSIEQALSFIQSPASLYQQAFCRFSKGDSLGVLNILDEVPSNYDLTQSEAELQNDYENYFALLLELRAEGKNLGEVDSLQKNVLYTIMQHGDNQLQAYCRNILVRADSLEYSEPYLFPEPIENKASEIKTPSANFATGSQPCFKLYPNPTKEYITIEYSLESASGVFEIYSINGIKKHTFKVITPQGIKTLDLKGWESGIYIIKLTSEGKQLQTEKFTKY